MQYRPLGRTGLQVSAISLGTEYLINLPDEHVASVIHEAVARGINYFDLFWPQARFRDQMGSAFAAVRGRVYLAAHLGAVQQGEQYKRTHDVRLAEEYFEDFVARYRTDYVDVLYLHNCDHQLDYERLMGHGGLADIAQRYKREGRTRLIGLSGHTVSIALQAVQSGVVDVLMFPISLAGHAIAGRKELFQTCQARGVGLVAMKPFGGGKLLRPERTLSLAKYQSGGEPIKVRRVQAITPVRCLAYVLAQVGVSAAVPGCQDLEQLAAALAYFTASDAERDYAPILSEFQQYTEGECVYCNHCLPCPAAIDIGQTIRLLEMAQDQLTTELRAAYAAMPSHASDCVECDVCEPRCPFGVSTVSKIKQAAEMFA